MIHSISKHYIFQSITHILMYNITGVYHVAFRELLEAELFKVQYINV
jgi:hypothetical protein